MSLKILIIVLSIAYIDARAIESCKISINFQTGDFKEPQPLILTRNQSGTSFLYPSGQRDIIELQPSQHIYLACPGKNNYLQGFKFLKNVSELEVTCLTTKTFAVNSSIFNLTGIACKSIPAHEARRTSRVCYSNSTMVEIGFRLRNNFLRTFEVCMNAKSHWTYYTKFNLSKQISSLQSGYPRPLNWWTGDFYNQYKMDVLYRIDTQLKTMTKLLGSVELARKYVGSNRYLSKGHLTAKADFVYGSAQRSTFWYMNAAPQWQSFNGGNWNTLEDNVRRFAHKRSLNLLVYTGIHGQMTLNDINGNDTPIYIYVNGTRRSLPVPRFYWKILYEPVAKLGTAFVGLNDPYASKVEGHMYLCKNVADKIKWLTWRALNVTKGVSYACAIDDLRKAVYSIPDIQVNGLLT